MYGTRAQNEGATAEGLGHSRQSPEIAGVLQAVDIDIDAIGIDRDGLQGRRRQRGYRQNSAWRVGVTDLFQDSGIYQRGVVLGRFPELPTQSLLGELWRQQRKFQRQPESHGLADEMRSLEQSSLTFTALKPANILDLLVLTTDDHGKGS